MRKTIGSPLAQVFCKAFVDIRKAAGMTQRELAQKLERERSFVARIELGERRVDLVEFHQICEKLGLDPAEQSARIFKALSSASTEAVTA